MREGDWKLISEMNRSTNIPKITLHNLADKKLEVKDYAKEKPKLVAHLTKLQEDWAKEVKPN